MINMKNIISTLLIVICNSFFYSQTISIIDKFTQIPTEYYLVSKFEDGTAMTDDKADGIIYIKKEGKYYRRNILEYDVRIFGANKTNADNSIYFNRAINFLSSIGGGKLIVPEGTWNTNIILKSKIKIIGAGNNITILRSPNNSNKDVIQSVDFENLRGTKKKTKEDRGVRWVELRDFSIDGNKQNNKAGYGIRIWGASLLFQNISAVNCKNDGIYTEYTTHDVPEDNYNGIFQSLESHFSMIKTIANDGNGWTYNGPHDSEIVDFVSFKNKGYAFYQINGSISGRHWNSWLNSNSYYFNAGVNIDNLIASGEVGIGIEFSDQVGGCTLSNIVIIGHDLGIILRGYHHKIDGFAYKTKRLVYNESGNYNIIDFRIDQVDAIYSHKNFGNGNVWRFVGKLLGNQKTASSVGNVDKNIFKDGKIWFPADRENAFIDILHVDTNQREFIDTSMIKKN